MNELEKTLLNELEKMKSVILKKISDPDLALDVLQDSLFKALRSGGSLKNQNKILPWFYRILNNTIIDLHRKKSYEQHRMALFKLEAKTVEEQEEKNEICGCLTALLPSLKPEYRDLIQTLDIEEKGLKETALNLGLTMGTLKVKRHRARKQLKKRLEETCRACAKHGCLDCSCDMPPVKSS